MSDVRNTGTSDKFFYTPIIFWFCDTIGDVPEVPIWHSLTCLVYFLSKIFSAVISDAVHSDCFKFVSIPSLICRHFCRYQSSVSSDFWNFFKFWELLHCVLMSIFYPAFQNYLKQRGTHKFLVWRAGINLQLPPPFTVSLMPPTFCPHAAAALVLM